MRQPNTRVGDMMRVLRSILGENDMMAYLMMAQSAAGIVSGS